MRESRRSHRHAQREILWEQSTLKRVRKCGRVPIDDVTIRDAGGIAHYSGLTTCGSIWACPVCSGKIRNTRATEVSAAAARWDLAGNSVYMVTFTAPHDMGMRLAPLMTTIADSFRAVISGRAWAGTPERFVPERPSKRGGMLPARYYPARLGVRDQVGIVGTIRSVEVTHGSNGWHPHLHVLVFVEGDPGAEGLALMTLHFRAKWKRAIVSAGYREPDELHGVKVDRCVSAAEAGAYIAKTQDGKAPGNELARGDLKRGRNGHRTPLEILEDFRQTGDKGDFASGIAGDLVLWHEYERATKGHQAITWSAGLKDLVRVEDRSDEDLAAEEVGGEVVVTIPRYRWKAIVRVPGLACHLLDQAERGGADAVQAALDRLLTALARLASCCYQQPVPRR